MTNTKTTKRALLMSVMALFLCVTMLMGTTYAWFTDSVTSANNKIVAGTLDVQLWMHNGTEYVDISDSTQPLFGADDDSLAVNDPTDTVWEPGKTQVVYLSIRNGGNLDLKYKVAINVKNSTNNLHEVMQYAITPDAQPDNAEKVTAWDASKANDVVLGINATDANNVVLKAGEEHYFALSVHMDEEAGNTYMNGTVDFDMTVLAGQLNSEEDSFGPDYDKLAPYADGAFVLNTIKDEVVPVDNGTFSYETDTFSISGESAEPEVKVNVAPAKNTNEMNALAVQTASTVLTYDISVEGHTAGSDVYVEFFAGTGLANVEIYHEGVLIDSDYDSESGFVSFTTDSFSLYSVKFTEVGILPLADVRFMTEDEYPEAGTIVDYIGVATDDGAFDQTLDIGYVFSAKESEIENIDNSPYKYWIADYVIKFDKDVATNSIAIAGQYDFFGDTWLGFSAVDVDADKVEAGEDDGFDGIPKDFEIRLLRDATGGAISMNYEGICTQVQNFRCGAFALDESAEGTTITVELRIYETYSADEAYEKFGDHSTNYETGKYETIGRYHYTF